MTATLSVLAAAVALGIAGAAVAHAVLGRSTQVQLHGQATWPAGARPAPAGVPRGRIALLAFLRVGCADCVTELRFVLAQLPARIRPTVGRRAVRGRSVLLLVDRRGDVRTAYGFPFAPAFVIGDLEALAR